MNVAINLLACIFLRDAGCLLLSGASVISRCRRSTFSGSRKNGVETSVPLPLPLFQKEDPLSCELYPSQTSSVAVARCKWR